MNPSSFPIGNIIIVCLIFSGIYSYDRIIEFSNYSAVSYSILLLSKYIGVFSSTMFFNQIWNKIGIFKYFILSIVTYCQFGILFILAKNIFILKTIAYAFIGFSVNSIILIAMGLLRSINANQFYVSIRSFCAIFALLITSVVADNTIIMLLVLFMSISSILPYLFLSNNSNLTPTIGINNQVSYKSFVVCYRYYGKFFWNLLMYYLVDALFSNYLTQKVLTYELSTFNVRMYIIGVIFMKLVFNYLVRHLMRKINPINKMIFTSLAIIISCICELFYDDKLGYFMFAIHSITSILSSLYIFPMEYFEKYRLQRHKAIPTVMVSNIIYGIAYLLSVPLGIMAVSMSARIGTTYFVIFIQFICVLNSIF